MFFLYFFHNDLRHYNFRNFYEQVRLFADASQQPSVSIPVSGRVVGELSVTPEGLFWGITNPKDFPGPNPVLMTTRKVMVEATGPDKTVQIKNATCSLKDVTIEVVEKEKGKKYELIAKLNEAPKDSEAGAITFETNLASQPKVTVPVTINVLKR